MNIQQIFLVGRATRDAESLKSNGGNSYAKFSIAVNEYKPAKEKAKGKKADKSEKVEEEKDEATFYDVLVFGKRSEKVAGMVKKGDLVAVSGKPEVTAYISKKDNEAKSAISVIAEKWTVVK